MEVRGGERREETRKDRTGRDRTGQDKKKRKGGRLRESKPYQVRISESSNY